MSHQDHKFQVVRKRDGYSTTVTIPANEYPTCEAAKARVMQQMGTGWHVTEVSEGDE